MQEVVLAMALDEVHPRSSVRAKRRIAALNRSVILPNGAVETMSYPARIVRTD